MQTESELYWQVPLSRFVFSSFSPLIIKYPYLCTSVSGVLLAIELTYYAPQRFIYLSTFKTFSRAFLCHAFIFGSIATNTLMWWQRSQPRFALSDCQCVPGELRWAFTQSCADLSCQIDIFKCVFSNAALSQECHPNNPGSSH